jgi:hypothetical protein
MNAVLSRLVHRLAEFPMVVIFTLLYFGTTALVALAHPRDRTEGR